MLVRGMMVLVFFSATTALAAPLPKSLKKSNKVDTVRFKVNYTKTPFDRVFEDFAEGTGLEWVGERPNLGTITLKPTREYNAAEFIDRLNELLERDNYCLVRHAGTFFLHPTDRPVDVEKVDTVSVEDVVPPREAVVQPAKPVASGWTDNDGWNGHPWARPPQVEQEKKEPPKRGKTELATLVMELPKGLTFADVRIQTTKSLSPFGRVVAGECDNEIRVTDRVDNLRTVVHIVTEPVKR